MQQMFVDDKPFIMLAGELHNSSASSIEYMKPIWNKLPALHLNTVIGTVSWELIEPEEGRFDFATVDAQISEARARGLRLVLIWFGTWKNASSMYVPSWVKADQKRFPPANLRVRSDAGLMTFYANYLAQRGVVPLSPFGEETRKADVRAFTALMQHIRSTDSEHTVIMMQIENEVGTIGDSRDRSPLAEAAWARSVPAGLLDYLVSHKSSLAPDLQQVWSQHGSRTSGTWQEVFGQSEMADQVFMAYYMASFINDVAKGGKSQLDLPMYVNAWLGPQPDADVPGKWPSGGPVAQVFDVYRAAAPTLSLLAPDIYVSDFDGTCALYMRPDNPLFVPEAKDEAGNLFLALGKYAALGWSPFGVEDLDLHGQVAKSYELLSEFLPQLAQWQADHKVGAILTNDNQSSPAVVLDGYRITISPAQGKISQATEAQPDIAGGVAVASRALPPDRRPFALVINTAPNEFIFIGGNGTPNVVTATGTGKAVIATKEEGHFSHGLWIAGRRINGDEDFAPGLPVASVGMLKIKLVRRD
jgi:beta-galactosidase GanA